MVRIPDASTIAGRDVSMRTVGNPQTGIDNAIPGAIEKFGDGVSKLGAGLKSIADERETQQDTLDITKANAHWQAGVNALDAKYKTESDPDYVTWGQRHKADLDKLRAEASGMITNENRRAVFGEKLDGQAQQYQLSIDERSKGVARDLGKQQVLASWDKNLSTVMDPATDPKRAEAIAAETKASIDSAVRTGILNPAQGEAQWLAWRQRRAGMQVERDIQADPEATAVKLGAGPTGTRAAQAMQILQSKGWTPVQAAGWVGRLFQESNLNPNARNPGDGRDGSDSVGINQWNGDRAKNLKAFAAARGKDWTDFGTQVEFIDHEARNSMPERTAFLAMQNAKTPEDAAKAAMHFARPAGYTSATPEAGHGFDNTVKHARRLAGGVGGGYSDLTAEQRAQYGNRAESAAIRQQQDTRVERKVLSGQIDDDLASIRTTGTPVDSLSRDRVEALLGRAEADKWERQRETAKTFHEITRDFDALPNNQIVGRIEGARPQGGKEGFAEAQAAHDEIAKKGSEIIRKRQQDPAMAVEEVAAVRKAREEAQYDGDGPSKRIKPESAQSIVRARLAAQDSLGIERQHAVTRGEARVISRQLRAIGEDDGAGLDNFMRSLRTTYGIYADAVLASSLELEGVNRELSNTATKVLGSIGMGRVPDISSIRQMDANIAWGNEVGGSALAGMAGQNAPIQAAPPPSDPMGAQTGMGNNEISPSANNPTPQQQRGPAGATFNQNDLKWLWQNRADPNAASEFDMKYGGGNASRVLRDLERRLGTKGKK